MVIATGGLKVRESPGFIIRMVDADTIWVFADLGYNIWYKADVRLIGLNCWEHDTEAGKAAIEYLGILLKPDTPVKLTSVKWDKYGGRVDGRIELANGSDVATLMIAAGYAAAWNGQGPKPVPRWPVGSPLE